MSFYKKVDDKKKAAPKTTAQKAQEHLRRQREQSQPVFNNPTSTPPTPNKKTK